MGAGDVGRGLAAAVQVAANIGPGGWAEWLGKAPTDLLTQADADRIVAYVRDQIESDSTMALWLSIPGAQLFAEHQIDNTMSAIKRALSARLGQPLAGLPADLGKLDEVRASVPGLAGPLAGWGGAGWVQDLQRVLGEVAGRGLLLAGIVAVILLGLWYVFKEPAGMTILGRAASVAGR